MHPASDPSGLKFGPFVVDLRAGELRKNGTRIRLQDKPLRVLALLAHRQGETVSREDLKKHLWAEQPSSAARTAPKPVRAHAPSLSFGPP